MILWDEFSHPRGRPATMTQISTAVATTHKARTGAATHHHDQSINPVSLAAVSASAARQANMSQRNFILH